jgi:hypothetical protein
MKTNLLKVCELTGAALDWAVAQCEGVDRLFEAYEVGRHHYSTDWAQGGPIIEREGISIVQQGDAAEWVASVYDYGADDWYLHTTGPTPLIAGMRCHVASKLGDEVDVPEELK